MCLPKHSPLLEGTIRNWSVAVFMKENREIQKEKTHTLQCLNKYIYEFPRLTKYWYSPKMGFGMNGGYGYVLYIIYTVRLKVTTVGSQRLGVSTFKSDHTGGRQEWWEGAVAQTRGSTVQAREMQSLNCYLNKRTKALAPRCSFQSGVLRARLSEGLRLSAKKAPGIPDIQKEQTREGIS